MEENPTIVNATPHAVNVYLEDGTIKTFPSIGVIRLKTSKQEKIKILDGIPIYTLQVFTEIDDPDNLMTKGYSYIIVSMPVGQFLANKTTDSGFLGTDKLVRDKNGIILGCERLVEY